MKRLLLALFLYSTGLLLGSYVVASEVTKTEDDRVRSITGIEIYPGVKQEHIFRNDGSYQSCVTSKQELYTQTTCF
jgi:hypothetical protein